MVFYVIFRERNDSEEFFHVEAIVREFGMSSAIRMCPL